MHILTFISTPPTNLGMSYNNTKNLLFKRNNRNSFRDFVGENVRTVQYYKMGKSKNKKRKAQMKFCSTTTNYKERTQTQRGREIFVL